MTTVAPPLPVGSTTKAAHAIRRQLRTAGVERIHIAALHSRPVGERLMATDSHWLVPFATVSPLFAGTTAAPGTYVLGENDRSPAVSWESDHAPNLDALHLVEPTTTDRIFLEQATLYGVKLWTTTLDHGVAGDANPLYRLPDPDGRLFAMRSRFLELLAGRDPYGYIRHYRLAYPSGLEKPFLRPVEVWVDRQATYVVSGERTYDYFAGWLMPIRLGKSTS